MAIVPVTVTVNRPASCGLVYDINIVAALNVINDVLCELEATTVAVYTMSVSLQYIDPDNPN